MGRELKQISCIHATSIFGTTIDLIWALNHHFHNVFHFSDLIRQGGDNIFKEWGSRGEGDYRWAWTNAHNLTWYFIYCLGIISERYREHHCLHVDMSSNLISRLEFLSGPSCNGKDKISYAYPMTPVVKFYPLQWTKDSNYRVMTFPLYN